MPDALPSLLSRIEAATGADREIDEMIAVVVVGFSVWKSKHGYWNIAAKGGIGRNATAPARAPGYDFDPTTGKRLPPEEPPTGWGYEADVPEWSSSVDAVLRLIERELPGWHLVIDTHGDPRGGPTVLAQLYPPGWPYRRGPDEARAATPALALLAALIRAKIAQTE